MLRQLCQSGATNTPRCFRTNDRQLHYRRRRLRCDKYTDTLDAKTVVSKGGNKYAQIFATCFGWYRAFPIKAKSEAHLGLSTLFARDRVPNVMVMDGAKEHQVLGDFCKKCAMKQAVTSSRLSHTRLG
jgi:hypothetical protein